VRGGERNLIVNIVASQTINNHADDRLWGRTSREELLWIVGRATSGRREIARRPAQAAHLAKILSETLLELAASALN